MQPPLILLFDTTKMPAAYGETALSAVTTSLKATQPRRVRPLAVWHGDIDPRVLAMHQRRLPSELPEPHSRQWLAGDQAAVRAGLLAGVVYAVRVDDAAELAGLCAVTAAAGTPGFIGAHWMGLAPAQRAAYARLRPAGVVYRGRFCRVFRHRLHSDGWLPKALVHAFPGQEAALLSLVEL